MITGRYNKTISPGSALTIRLELPNGYFIKQKINILDYLIYYLLPIICLGIAFLIWYKYGRDDKIMETVEFYPPDGLNSLEVGFLYKGRATNRDVISLLIYLANKGYLKINEYEKKVLFFKKKSFKIVNVKKYDGDNDEERLFLNGLFFNFSRNENGDAVVTKDDLYDSFYIAMNKILKHVNSQEYQDEIFEKQPKYLFLFIFLILYIVTLFLSIAVPFLDYGEKILFYLVTIITNISLKKISKIVQSFISSFLFIILSFIIVQVLSDPEFIFIYIVNVLCAFEIMLFYKVLPKRNKFGIEVLGKIKGFKTFLETAEKDKLDDLVSENPTYFYDILPYTYVLGVSDIWIKKFETIAMQAPTWYYGRMTFDIVRFNSFIDNTIAVSRVMVATSNSSSSNGSNASGGGSSGGSSGGSVSGGGSGGGGGGSW